MRRLDGITDSMDVSLNKPWETVPWEAQSAEWLNDDRSVAMMGESTLLRLLVTTPMNPSVGSAASTTSTNEDDICHFRCCSRAQRGRPRAHGAGHRAAAQLGGKAAQRPRGEPVPWGRVAGSLPSLAWQPWGPLPLALP